MICATLFNFETLLQTRFWEGQTMSVLTQSEGVTLLTIFGTTMFAVVWFARQKTADLDEFLVAGRSLSLFRGAASIAVSWIWAPAIFICSLQAFENGLPGIFWFTAPNILCFFVFAPFAIHLRKIMPEGYTLPQFIDIRFKRDSRVHLAFLVIFLGYQLGAIVINALAGGTLLSTLCGIPIYISITSITVISLTYSFISGLRASVLTDIIQFSIVLGIGLIIVPLCISANDGIETLRKGLAGVSGDHSSLHDPWIAFTMGIPMTLGLLAGPFSDQMFFQRSFAVEKRSVAKTFCYGGILFASVPILLSLLGFIGAGMVRDGSLTVSDPQVVGPLVIAALLPKTALYAFCLMALAGLCSTMDSALCAVSSLGSIDIYKRYFSLNATENESICFARISMVLVAFLGAGLALLQPKLLWVFLIYGALASAGMFPVMLAITWRRVTADGVFWGITLGVLLGTPISIYANVTENPYLIVTAAVVSVLISLITTVSLTLFKREELLTKQELMGGDCFA